MTGGERIDLPNGSIAWAPCYIGKECQIGANVSISCLAHIGKNVVIGDGTRIQGGAYIADGTIIGEDVFIGPNATILNDRYPPSRDSTKWELVTIENEAVIGGGTTLLPGINVGSQAVLAAGALLTRNIPSGEVWMGQPAAYHISRQAYEEARV